MALRLKVNEEFEELEQLLRLVPERLQSGGRFVVLTFMSTEDRIVKQSIPVARSRGAGDHSDEARDQAYRARGVGKSGVAQRQVAGARNELK